MNYLSAADTAKLVRIALKKDFPGIKFSVRSSTYSGGASIDVKWTDGPTTKEVDPVVKGFAGGRFDGMIDLKYHADHWLLPDGSTVLASIFGHSFDNEVVTPEPPVPGAVRVSFGADYVFTHREYSKGFMLKAAALALATADFGSSLDPATLTPEDLVEDGPRWTPSYARTGTGHSYHQGMWVADVLNGTAARLNADGRVTVTRYGTLVSDEAAA